MMDKVILVTGANKGLGFGIVRELCKRGVKVVYLGARDVKRGQEAVEKLKKEGLNPEFLFVDITDKGSLKTAAEQLKSKHGGLDVLINNAAVAPSDMNKYTYEDAKYTIDVNYRGNLNVREFLLPIVKDNGRVVNVTSDLGHLSNLKNPKWIERLSKKDLQISDIDEFVDWYLESVKNGTMKEEDFAANVILPYRISKIAVTALSMIEQREIGRNISVNALHPGFIQTDMTAQYGIEAGGASIEASSKTPVYLALDAPHSIRGAYIWFDKREIDWYDTSLNIQDI